MLGLKSFDETKLRTRVRSVSRVGTLCGMFAMLILVTGCPGIGGGGGGGTTGCDADTDCDDGLFCNGVETCDTDANECVDGTAPCTDPDVCNEDADRCDACGQEGQAACDDSDACTDDACVDGQCEFTDVVCDGDLVCDDATGECVDLCDGVDCDDGLDCTDDACDPATGECSNTDNCADDGDFCNGTESCDADANACVSSGDPCTDPDVCDEDADECVTPVGLQVTIDNCPSGTVAGDSTMAMTATVTGLVEGGEATFDWSATTGGTFDDATAASPTITFAPSGTAEICVDIAENTVTPGTDPVVSTDPCTTDADCTTAGDECNADGFCETPGTPDVLTPTGETASFCCDPADIEFTAEVLCNAGGLNPARATTGSYLSGTFTSGNNNPLNGTATQAGTDAALLVSTWTVIDQPAGSGTVSFSNSGALTTAFTIAPPASAGTYTFNLNVVNTSTGQTCDSTVDLNLLDPPTFAVMSGYTPVRVALLRGADGPTVDFTYTIGSDGFVEIYDGDTAVGTAPAAADLITSITLPEGEAADVSAAIPATGKRETGDADTFLATMIVTDVVGTSPADGTANVQGVLQDATATDAALRRLVLYTSQGWTETKTTGNNVPVIPLNTSVGIPDGGGTVIHYGVGEDANAGEDDALAHVARSVKVADINNDGFTDLLSMANATTLDIRYGKPDIVTQGAAQAAGGRTGDWLDTPNVTVTADANTADYAVGDFNNDGNLDVFFVSGADIANAVEVFLLAGSSTSATNTTPQRTYIAAAAAVNADLVGGRAGAGDVNNDGIDDLVWSFPLLDDDIDRTAGAEAHNATVNVDGLLFIHYGVASTLPTVSLAADGQLMIANTVSGVVSGTQNGQMINDTNLLDSNQDDNFGTLLTVGQYDSGAMDIVTGEGAGTGELRIYSGSPSGVNVAPLRTYTAQAATDLASGLALLGDTNGADGSTDVVVLAPGNETVYFVPNGLANGALLQASIPQFGTTLSVNTVAGQIDVDDDAALYDVDFDGDMDLVLGQNGDNRVLVVQGPVTGPITLESQIFRVYTGDAGNLGRSIAFGDVDGNGIDDFLMGDATNLFMLGGLNGQAPAAP